MLLYQKWFVLLLVLFLISFSQKAAAQTGEAYHLKLLAVQETGTGYAGSGADLYLELKSGSGRVFLETFPLTKMDTQISTRFAKDIACHHYKLPCQKYDFIYTIKAQSNIIGGPSAGAAIAALTTIALLDLPYDEGIAITGTVNSGGVIGPIGGLREKLTAAQNIGLKKVLIPQGSSLEEDYLEQSDPERNSTKRNSSTEKDGSTENDIEENGNTTVETNETGSPSVLPTLSTLNNFSISIQEVADLDEVLLALTGKDLNHQNITIVENKQYRDIMAGLQEMICSRTKRIQDELDDEQINLEADEQALMLQRQGKAQNASGLGDFYSAASYCFSNNIQLKQLFYVQKQLTLPAYERLFTILEKKRFSLQEQIAQEEITTVSDVQAVSIVQERLHEVQEKIQEARLPEKTPEELAVFLAYAEERYFSALAWKQFLAMKGKVLQIDTPALEQSCQLKIAESEERFQYASLFLGEPPLQHIREKITAAGKVVQQQEYPLCLMIASQAKAEANAILSSLGLQEKGFSRFLAGKRKAVERVIAENTAEEVFPILGYSYYQYAQSLEKEEPGAALLYLEYALEMSDLGLYFPEKQTFFIVKNRTIPPAVQGTFIGFLIGVGLAWWWWRWREGC